ncbi:MAG: site-2 protease family protein [Rhodospirillaceae bacterium]
MTHLNFEQLAFTASIWVLPVLLAVTFHEAAHGFVAWKLGDDTAKRLGRVTFDPLKHVDPVGTVILPVMLLLASGGKMMFGYAKPVPVNFGRLHKPRRDMVLVALAGPGANIVLAVLFGLGLLAIKAGAGTHMSPDTVEWSARNLVNGIWLNLILAVFNMLPVPPLDGGRVAVGILPNVLAIPMARMERAGMLMILLGIFVLPYIGDQIGVDLNVFWWLVGEPASLLMNFLFTALGLS